ncbi:MAG TPA: hypothetical protein VLV83_19845 [Acidobacteriota bacterium]|nr:hypothetical protein [Acidobacteriota bacterium]
MGSAKLPRIYFTGFQYWDPNTINNNDYGGSESFAINTWDPPKATFDYDYLQSQGVDDLTAIPPFLRKNIPYSPPTRRIPPAEWGMYGGQQCGFVTADAPKISDPSLFSAPSQRTLTTGYTGVDGRYSNDASAEPWLQKPLQLDLCGSEAKLVDVNPMSFWSSQIFNDSLTLGDTSAGFTAPSAARMHSRFISTAPRNYNSKNDLVIAADFGAVFQTCFGKDKVQFKGSGGPLQQQIQQAFSDGAAGLMLRYNAYSTLYFQGAAFDGLAPGNRYPLLEKMGQLYEAYAAGKLKNKPVSRAYSKVAGWIGIWMPGEQVSVPGGRFLIPYDQKATTPDKPAIAVTPSNLEASQYDPPPPDPPPNSDAPVHAPNPLGPATVEYEADASGNVTRLTLDLGNCIPERDSSGTKCDFGNVRLLLNRPGDAPYIWSVAYDQNTYERFGGLVDLSMAGKQLTVSDLARFDFSLEVQSGQSGSRPYVTALYETALTAQTDTRGLYAEQPDPSFSDGDASSPGPGMPSTAPTCQVQVRYKGYAPGQVPSGSVATKLEWRALSYTLAPYDAGKEPLQVNYQDPSTGQFVPFQGAIDVPADGSIVVQVVSKGAAIPNLLFLPYESGGHFEGAPFPSGVGIGSSYYTVIKNLNFDNALAVAFDQWLATNPTVEQATNTAWDLVFVIYFYGFPFMDFISDPPTFQSMAQTIVGVTDPDGFDGPGYMPVTRTWSAGQRHIMLSYSNYLQANKDGGPKTRVAPFKPPKPQDQYKDLSVNPIGSSLGHG